MAGAGDDLRKKLDNLSPEARARVESALKENIDRELVKEATAIGDGGRVSAFSRGILFSKNSAARPGEELVLPAIHEMDDAKFKTFLDRVTALKGTRGGGG
jgi:hypothetical protein